MMLILLLYLLSVVVSYFGIRYTLIKGELDPDWVFIIVMFTPGINMAWVAISIPTVADGEQILRKFFRM